MNYSKLKWVAAPLAVLSTFGSIVGDAQAFFGCFQRKMDTAASLYAGTGPCGGQRVVNYIPQTCYRVQYVQQAVTTYKPVCGTDPCTGCPVTTMKPVVCYRPAAQLVPYTTYRLVYSALQPACPTTATTYYAPPATCPQSCGTGACGANGCGRTTAAYAAPTTYAAPIATAAPAPGCSSCGTGAPTTYSSGYAPTSSLAPGYTSGVQLGAPVMSPSQTVSNPSTPASTYAPGSTSLGTTMPGGSTSVFSYGAGGAYPSSIAGPTTSTPGAATIVGPSAGPSAGGTYAGGTYSSGTHAGTPYSSGTATFAPGLTTTGGSASTPAADDRMTEVPASTFMFPPMRGGPAPAPAPSPSSTPSGTMPVMPTPLPGASPTPSTSSPAQRPIPDPEISPVGPTLGRPAATTPLLIDPKDQTVFAWPSRRAWGYAPIPGRAVPVVAASYTTVDGMPSGAAANPMSTAPSAPVRHETSYPPESSGGPATSVRAGDGWTRSGGGGGWQAVGR